MANLHQLGQIPMEFPREHDPEPTIHLQYQQTLPSRQFESDTSDRGKMPHMPTSSISPSNSMDRIYSYENPDSEMDKLANEWSETQILFGHDWGETETTYGELNPGMAQAEVCSPSQLFWPLGNLQSDGTFDNFSFQGALPENCYLTPALPASWNYPTPVSSTLSANGDQYNYYYEPNTIPEISHTTAQPPPKASYICETCGRTCPKEHILKLVHYIPL
jgi:hypothetical protein